MLLSICFHFLHVFKLSKGFTLKCMSARIVLSTCRWSRHQFDEMEQAPVLDSSERSEDGNAHGVLSSPVVATVRFDETMVVEVVTQGDVFGNRKEATQALQEGWNAKGMVASMFKMTSPHAERVCGCGST